MFTRIQKALLALAFLVAPFGAAVPDLAVAQSQRVVCKAQLDRCAQACDCAKDDVACLIRCRRYSRCLQDFNSCLERGAESRGGALEAPAPSPSPAPATRGRTAASPGTHSMRLEGRVFFLQRAAREPSRAKYYGYLVIGPNVEPKRKIAVMRGIGCRLDVVENAEEADKIKNLGLVSVPSKKPASGTSTNPKEMIDNYDTVRAERWLEAAEDAADVYFDPAKAILFIGSTKRRATQLDRIELPDLDDDKTIVVADASDLDPRYLSRWTYEVVQGIKTGAVASRQDMQLLMEYHSWFNRLGSPLAAVLKLSPTSAQASTAPASCL